MPGSGTTLLGIEPRTPGRQPDILPLDYRAWEHKGGDRTRTCKGAMPIGVVDRPNNQLSDTAMEFENGKVKALARVELATRDS
eukprot:1392697-Amorphochlora_amoeboformis.AAC.1